MMTQMNKKPRICEVLGVDVEEVFTHPDYPEYQFHVATNGWLREDRGYWVGGDMVCGIINHLDCITRQPRTGEKEEPMKQDKPPGKWMLEEVKNLCMESKCDSCVFDIPEGFCQLRKPPNSWCLDPKPRFTEEEVALAKALYAVIPDGVIKRIESGNRLVWDVLCESGMDAWENNRLPYKLFPSILPGQSVKLSEIVGGSDAEKEG